MKQSYKDRMTCLYYQRLECASTISEINNKVEKVTIEYKVVYSSFIGPVEKAGTIILKSNDKYMCRIQCSNKDCTEGYIDLSNEIWNATKSGMTNEGNLKCCGQEEKYKHTNSFYCDTILHYKIVPEIREEV